MSSVNGSSLYPTQRSGFAIKVKQTERVLKYIEENGSITQIQALNDCGVMRLASRISDLKKMGYPITSEVEAVKNRYGENCYIKRYSFAEGYNGTV